MKIECKRLKPVLWKDLETLFGANGACGGCWCMHWRQEKGEDWTKLKGAGNMARFKKLVAAGKANGAIAYVDGAPVGWASFDKRMDYSKLDRAPSFECNDAEKVWAMPCFFIKSGFRGKGVASALLAFSLKELKKEKAKVVEGYPTVAKKDATIPAAFAWTGTESLFRAAGFAPVGKKGGKQRMRAEL